MTAIVTGATGFIGSRLVSALAQAGEGVRVLVRRPGPISAPSRVRFHLADFNTLSLGLSDDVFDGVDVVYHLAGATRASSAGGFREANVALTDRLMERVKKAGVAPRFV